MKTMKLTEAAKALQESSGETTKEKILHFLRDHPDEVFRRRDIVNALHGKTKSTDRSISVLVRKLSKEDKIGRKTGSNTTGKIVGFYGTHEAIKELEALLSKK